MRQWLPSGLSGFEFRWVYKKIQGSVWNIDAN
jgi:hypothetical protein